MTEVRLRIAGIYFDKRYPFDRIQEKVNALALPGRNNLGVPTILELLETARHMDDLSYVFERRKTKGGTGFLSIVSLGNELAADLGPSLGGKLRRKGLYQLTETTIPNGVVAWQYYVYRKQEDGHFKTASSLDISDIGPDTAQPFSPADPGSFASSRPGFKGFDQFPLQPGDEVIWRMIAIQRVPTPLPERA